MANRSAHQLTSSGTETGRSHGTSAGSLSPAQREATLESAGAVRIDRRPPPLDQAGINLGGRPLVGSRRPGQAVRPGRRGPKQRVLHGGRVDLRLRGTGVRAGRRRAYVEIWHGVIPAEVGGSWWARRSVGAPAHDGPNGRLRCECATWQGSYSVRQRCWVVLAVHPRRRRLLRPRRQLRPRRLPRRPPRPLRQPGCHHRRAHGPVAPVSTSAAASAEASAPEPSAEPTFPTAPPGAHQPVTVTWRVDGDTLHTTAGKVRIIGIDTPEHDECGFAGANSAADALLAASGQQVTLTSPPGEDNTDKYGRLLRYVTLADGRDFGLAMLQSGVARARYDSLDGYDHHPLQDQYRMTMSQVQPDPGQWAKC